MEMRFCDLRKASGRLPGKSLFVAASLAGAVLVGSPAAMADSEGPFTGLSGNWRGSGQVLTSEGKTERIACKAAYKVSPDGINLAQSLVCASDSYKFDIRTDVFTDGNALRGTWQEMTRSENGNLTGQVSSGSIQTTVTAPGFSADVSVKTTGDKQVVSINPQGKDIAKVDVTLTR